MVNRIVSTVLALLLLISPAMAQEVLTGTDTSESITRILQQIEKMAGVLAMNRTLDEEQTQSLIAELGDLHAEVKQLRQANELLLEVARQAIRDNAQPEAAEESPAGQPATEAEAPAAEPAGQPVETEAAPQEQGTTPPQKEFDKWLPYLDFSRSISPDGAQYNGWVEGSSIDVLWGEPGQMIVTVNNGYTVSWTIENAYIGSPQATASTRQQGEIIVQVRDEDGVHEYSLRNGGLGQIFMRWISETEVAGSPA